MPLLVAEQRNPEWHAAHHMRVTASVAAGALGLSPHMSRQAAWRAITGAKTEAESRDNKHFAWGREFESQAIQEYECVSGSLVEPTGLWVSEALDWLGASPDGLVGSDGLVEVKCPGELPGAVPVHYRIQCLVAIYVTGRQWCDFFSWTHNGYFLKRIHRCEGIDGIVKRLASFYHRYVASGQCPERKQRRKKS